MASDGGLQAAEVRLDAARLEFMSRDTTPIYFDDWVYFIRSPYTGLVKIGYTGNNPELRIQGIENIAGHEMERIALTRGFRDLEKFIQKQFDAYCWRSEWFVEHDRLRAFIAANATPWRSPSDIPSPRMIETTDYGLTEIYWPKVDAIRDWFDSNP